MNLFLTRFSLGRATISCFSLAALLLAPGQPALSRGGGGAGGMRGSGSGFNYGGFGREGGYSRDGYARAAGYGRGLGRGFGEGEGRDDSGDMFNDRPDNVLNHTSESDLRSGADHVWSGSQHAMATDGGYGRSISAVNSMGRGDSLSRAVTPAALATRGDAVRGAFRGDDAFRGAWWGRHDGAWWDRGWGDDWAWGACGWDDLAGFWDYPVDNQPVDYDYGNNITYQGDTVYYGTQPTDTAAAYYTQAQNLAQSAPPVVPSNSNNVPSALAKAESKDVKDWKPLGVFSLTQGDQTDSSILFQLAVNKKGIVRGNYYNTLTQECKPLSGAVDKKNMRVAWEVEGAKTTVYDSGLSNLLHAQSPILVHFSKSRTEQWNLVRLAQPKKTT